MSEASQDAPGTVITGADEVLAGAAPDQGGPARSRRGRRTLRVLAAAGAVIAAAAAVTTALLARSPSDPPSALAALTGALAKTSAESYTFGLNSTTKYQGKAVTSDVVSGAFDPRREQGAELLTAHVARLSAPLAAKIVFIGGYVYTWASPGSGFKTFGKPWDRAPLPPPGTRILPASELYGFATDWPVSPDELLAVLRSTATVRDSGPVAGPGWAGTRYTFTSRLSKRWLVTGTADVDEQGRVRRLMTITTGEGGVITERDLTFSGFGASVRVTAPPADQVRYTAQAAWGFYF
jgi:hypothetical protein